MKFALTVLGASLLLAGCATGPKEEDHAAHHPSAAVAPEQGAPSAGQMESMMKAMQEMQEMHAKLRAAKTAEERSRLMGEHMKLMQESMAMMGGMSGTRSMSPDMLDKRMDMMEMMMQMMVDREAMKPPAAR